MTEHGKQPSEVIAARVKALRNRRGMSVAKLAARCAELGMPKLNQNVLTNLEVRGRHDVGVTELFVLAAALDTPPGDLLIGSTDEPLVITPQLVLYAPYVQEWLAGTGNPPTWIRKDHDAIRRWYESNIRLRLLERFSRGVKLKPGPPDYEDIASIANGMIENGVYPAPLPARLVKQMEAHGFRYSEQIHIVEEPAADEESHDGES